VTSEDYIRRVVDAAPPATDDQRSRIATLLRPISSSENSEAAVRTRSFRSTPSGLRQPDDTG
jgi:hypothetical protein